MKWRKEVPTVPAWYWWRRDDLLMILHVVDLKAEGLATDELWVQGDCVDDPISLYADGKWAGPIPLPEALPDA